MSEGLKPAKVTTADLVQILQGIARGIELGDSYEGSITYSCIDRSLGPDEYFVSATYRVDNRYGQGGMQVIGTFSHE